MSSPNPKRARNKKRERLALNAIVGASISGFAIWWISRSIEGKEVAQAFSTADRGLLAVAFLLTIASYLSRAFRWQFFFPDSSPKFADAWRCLIVGFFMNNILPARLGEFVRAHLGGRATSHSRTLVLATIAGERLVDGLTISLLFALLFTIGVRPDEVAESQGLFYVAYGFVAVGVMTGIVLLQRERAFRILEKITRERQGSVVEKISRRARQFIEGLEPLLRLTNFVRIAIISIAVWCIELLVYYCITQAFGQVLSLGGLALFLAAVNFSSLIPAAPGGIGTIEAMTSLALVHIGVPYEIALAMVVSQHIIQWIVVGLPGAYYFLVRMHGKVPEPVDVDESSSTNSDSPVQQARVPS